MLANTIRLLACTTTLVYGAIVLTQCALAIEPVRKLRPQRPVPNPLRLEDVIVYAVPPDIERPATYVDESHIETISLKVVWPEIHASVIPEGYDISVQITNPARLHSALSGLQAARDDELVELGLTDSRLDEHAFDILNRFNELKSLGCRIRNDWEAIRICETWSQLECLTMNEFLEESNFTDRGLGSLAKLQNLRGLRVHSVRLSGAGFRSLASVPSLEGIHFAGNRSVRGTDISALSKLARLREVVLWVPSDFSDAELLKFAECKSLQHICLFGAEGVTRQGIAALQTALPRCVIHARPELGAPKHDDLPKE